MCLSCTVRSTKGDCSSRLIGVGPSRRLTDELIFRDEELRHVGELSKGLRNRAPYQLHGEYPLRDISKFHRVINTNRVYAKWYIDQSNLAV